MPMSKNQERVLIGNSFAKKKYNNWSILTPCCVGCGKTDRPHAYRGHCKDCMLYFRNLFKDLLAIKCELYVANNWSKFSKGNYNFHRMSDPDYQGKKKAFDELNKKLFSMEKDFKNGKKTTKANREKFHGVLLELKHFSNREGDYSIHSSCCLQCRSQYHKDGIPLSKAVKRTSA